MNLIHMMLSTHAQQMTKYKHETLICVLHLNFGTTKLHSINKSIILWGRFCIWSKLCSCFQFSILIWWILHQLFCMFALCIPLISEEILRLLQKHFDLIALNFALNLDCFKIDCTSSTSSTNSLLHARTARKNSKILQKWSF